MREARQQQRDSSDTAAEWQQQIRGSRYADTPMTESRCVSSGVTIVETEAERMLSAESDREAVAEQQKHGQSDSRYMYTSDSRAGASRVKAVAV